MEPERGEVQSLIIWSITSLPSHMIFMSQLPCAVFNTLAAMEFWLLDPDFLLIQKIKIKQLEVKCCYYEFSVTYMDRGHGSLN